MRRSHLEPTDNASKDSPLLRHPLVAVVHQPGLVTLFTYPGYDFFSQVISEQSAIGAPGRELNVAMGVLYDVLVVAFGIGVWLSAENCRNVKIAGALLVAGSIYGSFWPPMHMRGAPTSVTDLLHIVWTAAWFAFTITAMFLAAGALGRRFMNYTVLTVAAMLLFGFFTGLLGPRLPQNLPTPGIGIYERINIGAFLLWIMVLALALWPHSSVAQHEAWSVIRRQRA